jgi:hypothetical protein
MTVMATHSPAPPKGKGVREADRLEAAQRKEQTLINLLGSRARAWDGYFDGLSLAYLDAHTRHTDTLARIKERIRNQHEFLKNILIGVLLPSMVGGGMAALVADKGKALTERLLPVATRRQALLASFGVGGVSTITEDVVKQEVSGAVSGLTPQPGAEWDDAGESPLKFFIKFQKMVNDYATDVTRSVELARDSGLVDRYVDTVNAHLLSPFIQNAPMDTDVRHNSEDLARVFEVFLWVVWARNRDVKYWTTQIQLAQQPADRGLLRSIWDGITQDDDALDQVKARDAVRQLNPILDRLVELGIPEVEVTQGVEWARRGRMLNILWVRWLGRKHPDTVLADLVSNLDAKAPTSALDGKPITKFRRLM